MTLRGTTQPLHLTHDVALIDLDGVLYKGPYAIEHAPESLTAAREGGLITRFVTNNAAREPQTVADHLTELGIVTKDTEVVTSAQAGAALLSERFEAGSRILVVGGKGLRTAVTERGFTIVSQADEDPVAVIQGWDADVSWTHISEACFAIERGAAHVATNLDYSIPKPGGIAPGNGALVEMVAKVTGRPFVSTGKPEPEIFRTAARLAGGTNPLVIGDRLDTDIEGAVSADMGSLHVLTGVDTARTIVLTEPALRPTYLAHDLRDLLVPHPLPVEEAGVWTVEDASAAVRDGRLHLADGSGELAPVDPDAVTVSLNAYRALVSAAWQAADSGAPVEPATVPEITVVRD